MMAVMSFFNASHFMANANATTRIDQLLLDSATWSVPCTTGFPGARDAGAARNGRGHVAYQPPIEELDRLPLCDARICRGARADAGLSRTLLGRGDRHESRRRRADRDSGGSLVN